MTKVKELENVSFCFFCNSCFRKIVNPEIFSNTVYSKLFCCKRSIDLLQNDTISYLINQVFGCFVKYIYQCCFKTFHELKNQVNFKIIIRIIFKIILQNVWPSLNMVKSDMHFVYLLFWKIRLKIKPQRC